MGWVFQDQNKEQTEGALRPPDPGLLIQGALVDVGGHDVSRSRPRSRGRCRGSGADMVAVPATSQREHGSEISIQKRRGWSGVTSEARGQEPLLRRHTRAVNVF